MFVFNEWLKAYEKEHPDMHLLTTREICGAAYAAGMRDAAIRVSDDLDRSRTDWKLLAANLRTIAELIEAYIEASGYVDRIVQEGRDAASPL